MSGIFRRLRKDQLSPILSGSQRRYISFHDGTERLKDTDDPTLRKNILEIDVQDKLDRKETHVFRGGVFSHYDPQRRFVFLPLGDEDPVAGSHELQHARDFIKFDVIPDRAVFELRALKAQAQTAKDLGLDDQLNGSTPEQRAKTHSQVKTSSVT